MGWWARLLRLLLDMIQGTGARLLEFCRGRASEGPLAKLFNSGKGLYATTKGDDNDGVTDNHEGLRNRSNCTRPQGNWAAKPPQAIVNDGGVQSKKEKKKKTLKVSGGMDVSFKVHGLLRHLKISQEHALLVRKDGTPNREILRGVISLIFENAGKYPKQSAIYAELCWHLSTELTEVGGEKKNTFRSVLVSKCQEAFEGDGVLRVETTNSKQMSAVEGDASRQKTVKLGIIKLIGGLCKQKLLPGTIVHACIQDLLGEDPYAIPAEENVEAVCHLFNIAGKQLEESAKSKLTFDTYFARLEVIGGARDLPSRIRWPMKNVLDKKLNKWMCLQDRVKAKTMNKIRKIPSATSGLQSEVPLSPRAMPVFVNGAGGSMPRMPGTGAMQGMLGMPGFPEFSGMPAMHGLLGVSGFPKYPGMVAMSGMPGLPAMPGGRGGMPGAITGSTLKPDGSEAATHFLKRQEDIAGLLPPVRGFGSYSPLVAATYGAAVHERYESHSVQADSICARHLLH